MRKVDDGEKKRKEKKKKIMTFIVATTSLPVDRPNADLLECRTLVPIVYIQKGEPRTETNFSKSKFDPSLPNVGPRGNKR